MKNLKSFKIFESGLMLDTNILSEILQEVTDLGYLSHVQSDWWSKDSHKNSFEITIYGKDEYDKKLDCDVAYIYPDDIMEVLERLVDFLKSEGYKLDDTSQKEIDVIKKRPTEKSKWEIKVTTSRISQVTMRWDDRTSSYKVAWSLGLGFMQQS